MTNFVFAVQWTPSQLAHLERECEEVSVEEREGLKTGKKAWRERWAHREEEGKGFDLHAVSSTQLQPITHHMIVWEGKGEGEGEKDKGEGDKGERERRESNGERESEGETEREGRDRETEIRESEGKKG